MPVFGDPTPDARRLYLSARFDQSVDKITHIGVNSEASDGFDVWFDHSEPPNPPVPNFVSAYFNKNDWDENLGRRFNSDVCAPIQEGNSIEWTMTVTTGNNGAVTLSWGDLERSLPEGYKVVLTDVANEREINLHENESYEYFSNGSHQFGIVASAPDGSPDTRDLHVSMSNGWNIISLNVVPGNEFYRPGQEGGPDVRLVLDQLRDEQGSTPVDIFKDENGNFYLPRRNFCNIPFWNLSQGYQIKVTQATELIQTGTAIPTDTPIPIESGWNLISYYPDYQLSARAPNFEVISSIRNDVVIAKDQDGQFMIPRINFSNMPPWREGKGYHIKVSNDVELTYPGVVDEIGEFVEVPGNPGRSHWTASDHTDRNMSLLLTGFNGIDLTPGDEMAAFAINGAIVGWGVVDADRNCGLAVWGDDVELEGKQGLSENEEIILQLWQSSNQTALTIKPRKILEGKGLVYSTDDFSVIEVMAAAQIPLDHALYGAFPNPFNSSSTISFGLPEKAIVKLSIVNPAAVLQSGESEAGRYNLRWNAESLSSGIYFVRLEAGNFMAHKMVNLIK